MVLAAGAGTRFGEPKAGAILRDGVRFVDAVLATARAAGLAPIVVVTPPGFPPLADVRAVTNPLPHGEQIQSVRRGLAQLTSVDVTGAVVWPVDHPYVELESVLAVLDAAKRTRALIVLPVAAGRRGHPVYFSRQVWGELMTVAAGGARSVVHAHEAQVHEVAVTGSGVTRDVDTRADMTNGEEKARNAVS